MFEEKYTIKCVDCGHEFEVTVPTQIDVTSNLQLRINAVDGSMFNYYCPKCNRMHKVYYPFKYIDKDYNLIIDFNQFVENIMHYETELRDQIKDCYDKKENMLRFGVSSMKELQSKILMTENHLDYRIGTLYCVLEEIKLVDQLEKENDLVCDDFYINDSYFNMNENNLCINVEVCFNDKQETRRIYFFEFDIDLYNMIKEEYYDKLNYVFNYCFDRDIARKLLLTPDEETNKLLNTNVEIALFINKNMDTYITYIPEYNKGKYKESDIVCIEKNGKMDKGEIIKIFEDNLFSLPFDIDDLYRVTYKSRSNILVITGDSDEELDNTELKKMFQKYSKKQELDEDLIAKSNVIIGSLAYYKDNDEDIIGEDGIVYGGWHMRLLSEEHEDGELLCVYLEQKDLNYPKASRCIYNLADIINLVLNNPHDYKGIIINPESDAVKVDIKRLARYKTDSVMCHADKMKKLLKELNQKEISYIGDLSYDSICKAYYEKTTPKNIAKDLGKTYDEIDEALDNGYTALMKIVFDNYN